MPMTSRKVVIWIDVYLNDRLQPFFNGFITLTLFILTRVVVIIGFPLLYDLVLGRMTEIQYAGLRLDSSGSISRM